MTAHERGSEVAGYRIESLIGRGGMAEVYRAEDLRLGRMVALKLLSPQLADNDEFRKRFIREIAARRRPWNTPTSFRSSRPGRLTGSCSSRCATSPATTWRGCWPSRAAGCPWSGRWSCSDRSETHSIRPPGPGSVHRDVKPGNILVASGSHPGHAWGDHLYLTDFGLTKRTVEVTGGLTGTGRFLGTVHYVSPEQIQGKAVGPGTDIYAWAACSISA